MSNRVTIYRRAQGTPWTVDAAVAHHVEVRRALRFHAMHAMQRVRQERLSHYREGRVSLSLRRGMLDMHILVDHRDGGYAAARAAYAMGLVAAAGGSFSPPLSTPRHVKRGRRLGVGMNRNRSGYRMNASRHGRWRRGNR